jgi:hypothetical protein
MRRLPKKGFTTETQRLTEKTRSKGVLLCALCVSVVNLFSDTREEDEN